MLQSSKIWYSWVCAETIPIFLRVLVYQTQSQKVLFTPSLQFVSNTGSGRSSASRATKWILMCTQSIQPCLFKSICEVPKHSPKSMFTLPTLTERKLCHRLKCWWNNFFLILVSAPVRYLEADCSIVHYGDYPTTIQWLSNDYSMTMQWLSNDYQELLIYFSWWSLI